jgi:hypothetical protein
MPGKHSDRNLIIFGKRRKKTKELIIARFGEKVNQKKFFVFFKKKKKSLELPYLA